MNKSRALVCIMLAFCLASTAWAGDTRFTIGISQIVEHPALDTTRKGFVDYLSENGYKQDGSEPTYFQYLNAQNNRATSGQIARQLVGIHPHLILAISTPSAQDVAASTKEIPVLFSAITDPMAAGLVKSLSQPGGNVSGTTDKSPVSLQLDLIHEILPSIKNLGTIYNPGEANSVASLNEIKAEAAKRGITVIEAPAVTSAAVKMAAESLVGKVDAVHIPTDNTVVLAIESVVRACQDNKIPLFAADVDSVNRGAIAALAVDYYKLGRQTGAMAVKILKGEAKVSEMPVEHQEELLLYLNPGQAEKMGVTLPETVIQKASKIIK
jgi:putative ABC transport system substrate-binding protein